MYAFTSLCLRMSRCQSFFFFSSKDTTGLKILTLGGNIYNLIATKTIYKTACSRTILLRASLFESVRHHSAVLATEPHRFQVPAAAIRRACTGAQGAAKTRGFRGLGPEAFKYPVSNRNDQGDQVQQCWGRYNGGRCHCVGVNADSVWTILPPSKQPVAAFSWSVKPLIYNGCDWIKAPMMSRKTIPVTEKSVQHFAPVENVNEG